MSSENVVVSKATAPPKAKGKGKVFNIDRFIKAERNLVKWEGYPVAEGDAEQAQGGHGGTIRGGTEGLPQVPKRGENK